MKLSIAGLTIDFDTRFPEYVEKRCASYLVPDSTPSELSIRASENDIAISNNGKVATPEAEIYALSNPLSNILPDFNRLMMHGVALTYKGLSYIFTAKSGTGKSTHAFLWQRYLGEDKVEIINGDKPILWFRENGQICACGGPWNGKEGLDKNVCVPLGGICMLNRLETSPEGGNRIEKSNAEQTIDFLVNQIFIPKKASVVNKTFQLIERLYNTIPVYTLYADMSKNAVQTSIRTLTGETDA